MSQPCDDDCHHDNEEFHKLLAHFIEMREKFLEVWTNALKANAAFYTMRSHNNAVWSVVCLSVGTLSCLPPWKAVDLVLGPLNVAIGVYMLHRSIRDWRKAKLVSAYHDNMVKLVKLLENDQDNTPLFESLKEQLDAVAANIRKGEGE